MIHINLFYMYISFRIYLGNEQLERCPEKEEATGNQEESAYPVSGVISGLLLDIARIVYMTYAVTFHLPHLSLSLSPTRRSCPSLRVAVSKSRYRDPRDAPLRRQLPAPTGFQFHTISSKQLRATLCIQYPVRRTQWCAVLEGWCGR